MVRRAILSVLSLLLAIGAVLSILVSLWWLILVAIAGVLLLIAAIDVMQTKHSILRNYPLLGYFRFAFEKIRPEVQPYFIERNYDGRPYDRDTRSLIYERAKGVAGEKSFGTERNVNKIGYGLPGSLGRSSRQA
ncbi:MAG: hypothetical protein ABI137_04315 [Antricoccus sp.]